MATKPTKQSPARLQAEVARLTAENKKLRQENAAIKRPSPKTNLKAPSLSFWRKLGIFVAITLAGALLVAGNVLFWAGRSVIDDTRYNNAVGPLIAQPSVQEAVASYATDQLYENVDVQQYTAQALPPQISFLAPALSTQIQSYTQKTIQGLLGSPKFQTLWVNVNQKAHAKVINFVTNYEGDGTISLNDIYQQISQDLAGTNLAFLSGRTLPEKVGTITVVQANWLPTAHRVVTHIDLWRNLAVLAVLLLSIAAVMLARKRRRVVITLGVLFAVLMSLWLVALGILQSHLVSQVNPAYQAAVKDAAGIILHSLRLQTVTIGLISALAAMVAWLTGPYRSAAWLQKQVQDLLAGRLHGTIFKKEYVVTTWIGRYKRVTQWVLVGLAGLLVVFTHNTTPRRVIIAALVTLLLALVLEVLGAPTA
jgi:hypothetical protein